MRRALLPVLLVFLAAGCAKVEPAADFAKMAAVVAEREGAQPLWRRTPEDDAAVASPLLPPPGPPRSLRGRKP